MAELENSKRYDAKYGFWPTVVENQDFLNKIVTKMIESRGLAKEIAPLKAKYEAVTEIEVFKKFNQKCDGRKSQLICQTFPSEFNKRITLTLKKLTKSKVTI